MLIEYRIRFEKGGVVVSQNITGGQEPFGGGGQEPFGGGGQEPFGGGGQEPFGGGGQEPFGGGGLPNGIMAVILGPVIIGRAPAADVRPQESGEKLGQPAEAQPKDLRPRPK